MIHASIQMFIPLQKHKEAVQILDAVAESARTELGCLGCQVYQGVKDRRLIHLTAYWESEDHLNRHLRSERYRNVLLVLEMALEQPVVRFDHIGISSGMDTIEVARNQVK